MKNRNVKHNVLNAKQHDKEAKIIAEAGKTSVTIATNMAGRGTDIKLGGNKDFIKQVDSRNIDDHKKDETKVKDLGGLFILGTERHESEELTANWEADLGDKEILDPQYFLLVYPMN